jgi:hypothetical protein
VLFLLLYSITRRALTVEDDIIYVVVDSTSYFPPLSDEGVKEDC